MPSLRSLLNVSRSTAYANAWRADRWLNGAFVAFNIV